MFNSIRSSNKWESVKGPLWISCDTLNLQELTFKLGDRVTGGRQSSDATVPHSGVATSAGIQTLVLEQVCILYTALITVTLVHDHLCNCPFAKVKVTSDFLQTSLSREFFRSSSTLTSPLLRCLTSWYMTGFRSIASYRRPCTFLKRDTRARGRRPASRPVPAVAVEESAGCKHSCKMREQEGQGTHLG